MASSEDFYGSAAKRARAALEERTNATLESLRSARARLAAGAQGVADGIPGTARELGLRANQAAQAIRGGAAAVGQAGQDFAGGVRGTSAESVFDPPVQQELKASNARVRAMNNPGVDANNPRTARAIQNVERIGSGRTAPADVRVQGPTAPSRFGTPDAAPKGFFRNAGANVAGAARSLRGAGPALGAANIGLEAYNATRNIQEGENPLKSIGRGALRGGSAFLGAAGGAALGAASPVPGGALMGGLAGGYGGYEAGDFVSDALFGPAPGSPDDQVTQMMKSQPSPSAAPHNQQVMTGRSSAAGDTLNGQTLPTVGRNGQPGPSQTPQELISGTAVPARGTGAFQVTQADGTVNPAQGVDFRNQQVQPQGQMVTAQARDDMLFGPKEKDLRAPLPGVFGEMAQRQSLRSRHKGALIAQQQGNRNADRAVKMRGQDAVAGAAAARNATAVRAEDRAAGAVAEKRVNDSINTIARASVSQEKQGEDYEPAVKEASARLNRDIDYTMGDRFDRRKKADLQPIEINQLRLASEAKRAMEGGRSSIWKSIKEMIGTKRFDSRDLYSYMPEYRDGNTVYFKNENNVDMTTIVKGGRNWWNVLFPNDPADTQFMEIVKGLPSKQEYEAARKKGK